jgi:hypothetical protein
LKSLSRKQRQTTFEPIHSKQERSSCTEQAPSEEDGEFHHQKRQVNVKMAVKMAQKYDLSTVPSGVLKQ